MCRLYFGGIVLTFVITQIVKCVWLTNTWYYFTFVHFCVCFCSDFFSAITVSRMCIGIWCPWTWSMARIVILSPWCVNGLSHLYSGKGPANSCYTLCKRGLWVFIFFYPLESIDSLIIKQFYIFAATQAEYLYFHQIRYR